MTLKLDPIEEICGFDWNGATFEKKENGTAVMVDRDETFVFKPADTEEIDCWELWCDGALLFAGSAKACIEGMISL